MFIDIVHYIGITKAHLIRQELQLNNASMKWVNINQFVNQFLRTIVKFVATPFATIISQGVSGIYEFITIPIIKKKIFAKLHKK